MGESAAPSSRPYILVFGATVRPGGEPSPVLRRRIEGAYSAWRLMPSAKLILSGGVGRHGPAEALVMHRELAGRGVPEADLLLDTESCDTLASARACVAILESRSDVGQVWVCTSAFHAPRCRLLMRLQGVSTGIVHVPPAETLFARWSGFYWVLRECLALPWDAALLLARRRDHGAVS
jgi:vancomycin permeability regulator SanA